MISISRIESTLPVGLLGELMAVSLVLGGIRASRGWAERVEPFSPGGPLGPGGSSSWFLSAVR